MSKEQLAAMAVDKSIGVGAGQGEDPLDTQIAALQKTLQNTSNAAAKQGIAAEINKLRRQKARRTMAS